jgi:predicted ATPase
MAHARRSDADRRGTLAPGAAEQIAALTGRLVEKSLLSKLDDGAPTQGGNQLLETIRQYAIEQLTAAGEIDVVRRDRTH